MLSGKWLKEERLYIYGEILLAGMMRMQRCPPALSLSRWRQYEKRAQTKDNID